MVNYAIALFFAATFNIFVLDKYGPVGHLSLAGIICYLLYVESKKNTPAEQNKSYDEPI